MNKDSFLSFQSGYVLLLYSCLITLVRTSSTVLSRTSESRHPSLVYILRASIQPFIIKYDVAAAVAAAKSLQSCPTLCDPIDGQPTRLPRPWDSPGKNTGVGKYDVSVRFFVDVLHQIEGVPFYFSFAKSFYQKWVFSSVQLLSCVRLCATP